MENKGLTNPQDIQIQGLLDRYLRLLRVSENNPALQSQHLDEDSLAAFTEGNLSEREAQPMIRHLVDCSFCRHVTTELVRLDLAFASEEIPAAVVSDSQPSKISEVLNNLLSRLFGSTDGAVFAHEEKEETEKSEDSENKKQ